MMQINKLAPVVITKNLQDTKAFYKDLFELQVAFETDWYIHLLSENGAIELGFMLPGLETQHAAYRKAFSSEGMILNLETETPDAWFERVKTKNIPLIESLRDEPWGERHFTLRDPNGIILNISKPIEPSAEFAENYSAS